MTLLTLIVKESILWLQGANPMPGDLALATGIRIVW
jgi:hypothetical protein